MTFASRLNLYTAAAVMLAVIGCSGPRYPGGRDTVASFCDGRYQVLKGGSSIAFYDLVDEETHQGVSGEIVVWSVEGNWVYFTNFDRELILLNCKSAAIERYETLAAAPERHKPSFEALLKTAAERNPRLGDPVRR